MCKKTPKFQGLANLPETKKFGAINSVYLTHYTKNKKEPPKRGSTSPHTQEFAYANNATHFWTASHRQDYASISCLCSLQ